MEGIQRLHTLASAFDGLRKHNAEFVDACDGWMADLLACIRDSKAAHVQRLADAGDEAESVAHAIEATKTTTEQMARAENADAAELRKKEEEDASLNAKYAALQDEEHAKADEVARITRELNACKQKLQAALHNREMVCTKHNPDLKAYQENMSMVISAVSKNILRFTYTHINQKNWEQEYSFVLDVSEGKQYKIMDCIPPLPGRERMLKFLNDSRDFYRFLKEMRKAFCNLESTHKTAF
ncbi:chromosome segregation protein Spc25-domain-containing protein [Chytriomyces sp. MP71]|nr:chromosome segregation protein Spc25-domain-containing protein [Chytriomyces sp. MP71]